MLSDAMLGHRAVACNAGDLLRSADWAPTIAYVLGVDLSDVDERRLT